MVLSAVDNRSLYTLNFFNAPGLIPSFRQEHLFDINQLWNDLPIIKKEMG